jgi:hypothetical protein
MNLEFYEEGLSISETQEAAALATEMLSWGQWTGEEIDFLTRFQNMEGHDIEVLQEMYSARERERNLRR